MKPIHFILFLLTLPVLISLGHDLYLFYVAQGQEMNPELLTKIYTEERPGREFSFAAFGYIWTQYEAESYKAMAESTDPAEWARIQEFLKIKATLFFGAIAGAGFGLALLLKIISMIREGGQRMARKQKMNRHR